MPRKLTISLFLPHAQATKALGAHLSSLVPDAAVFALVGPLGAGKTTFVQGVGSGLGVSEIVNSPTFTMLNEYHSGRLPLYHMDFYRLRQAHDKAAFGGSELELLRYELEEVLAGPGLVLIEWADEIKPYLPADHLRLELNYLQPSAPELGREAFLAGSGARSRAIVKKLSTWQFKAS